LEGVHSGVKRRRRNRARSRAIGGAGLGGAGQKEDQQAQNEKRQGTTSSMTLLVISTELADDVGVAYHAGRGRIRAVTVCTNSWCHVTMDISI
jgi:hypothetical protein